MLPACILACWAVTFMMWLSFTCAPEIPPRGILRRFGRGPLNVSAAPMSAEHAHAICAWHSSVPCRLPGLVRAVLAALFIEGQGFRWGRASPATIPQGRRRLQADRKRSLRNLPEFASAGHCEIVQHVSSCCWACCSWRVWSFGIVNAHEPIAWGVGFIVQIGSCPCVHRFPTQFVREPLARELLVVGADPILARFPWGASTVRTLRVLENNNRHATSTFPKPWRHFLDHHGDREKQQD